MDFWGAISDCRSLPIWQDLEMESCCFMHASSFQLQGEVDKDTSNLWAPAWREAKGCKLLQWLAAVALWHWLTSVMAGMVLQELEVITLL